MLNNLNEDSLRKNLQKHQKSHKSFPHHQGDEMNLVKLITTQTQKWHHKPRDLVPKLTYVT